jgi:hypothetical protein
LLLVTTCLAVAAQAAGTGDEKIPGYVDCSGFLDLAGEDTGSVEVNLQGALLKALVGIDPELKAVVGGLRSIHAVILHCGDKGRADRAVRLIRGTEERLVGRGWDVLTRVRNGTSNVTVLVLSGEETIDGLVVLAADASGNEVVCANIAGLIDLAAIAKLGEHLDIPGLDEVDK